MSQPFPWARLQRLSAEHLPLMRALGHARAAAGMRAPAGSTPTIAGEPALARIALAPGLPCVCERAALMQHVGIWGTSVFVLARGHELRCHVALPAGLLRAIGSLALFQRLDEWAAPRLATHAELGVAALCMAALLRTRYGLPDITVDISPLGGAEWVRALEAHARVLLVPVDVALDRETHVAHLIMDERVAWAGAHPVRLGRDLIGRRGARLATACLHPAVVVPCARIPVRDIRALAPRDVVLLERVPDAGCIRVGRGHIPVSVDLGAARAAVTGPYQRAFDPMNELLFDDATVEVTCRVGRVHLSARELLQLEPGQVLALDTPIPGPFDLMCGETVIARAELVDVDGRVGVRILSLTDSEPPDSP